MVCLLLPGTQPVAALVLFISLLFVIIPDLQPYAAYALALAF